MRWHPYILCIILAPLLAACGASASARAISVPTAIPPAAVQPTPNIMPNTPPATCPVTRPPNPAFMPPAPYSRYAPSPEMVWYGTDALWTEVPKTGVWSGLPDNPAGYTQKVFWWRKGYSWTDEPEPQLVVTGRLLDATAESFRTSRATNAFAEDIQSAMLVGVDFPTLGCWEITGHYAGTQLSFVVWVAP
jgi:hypothetical protein